jgi:preprotein translocase SecF subunit
MRFEWVFGAAAVIAIFHDLVIALAIFLLMGRSMTLDIASALLIILGYSVNDTIVVFDRIRENRVELHGKSMTEIINISVNQTLTRTLFTSFTTLLAVTCMLLFGGVGLSDFALILLVGIIAGTYSTIFIASALVNIYFSHREKKEGLATVHARTKTVKIGA